MLNFKVFRYDPVTKTSYLEQHRLEEDKVQMVLDGLLMIQQKDPSLGFRKSCREGVCGSCAMNINGTNTLACITNVSKMKSKDITIYPLPHLEVLKDLIVDIRPMVAQFKSINPYVVASNTTNNELKVGYDGKQSLAERAQIDGMWECIMCFCCSSSCPSYWWNKEQFLGPATLLQAARFIADSKDQNTQARLEALKGPFKLYKCESILNCTSTCPKNLNPAKIIASLKIKVAAS